MTATNGASEHLVDPHGDRLAKSSEVPVTRLNLPAHIWLRVLAPARLYQLGLTVDELNRIAIARNQLEQGAREAGWHPDDYAYSVKTGGKFR